MKKFLYGILSSLLILTSCIQRDELFPHLLRNNDKNINVSFSIQVTPFTTVHTRSNEEINDLYLLVFDESGKFILRRKAILSKQTATEDNFIVQLPISTEPRTIHFISNFDWTSHKDIPGLSEAEVITPLFTTDASYWARIELKNGITYGCFDDHLVELLLNRAKISVTNEAADFSMEGFTIHHSPNRGTVAPFSTSQGFKEGEITEPSNYAFIVANASDLTTHEKYLFERKNAGARDITSVIVKGEYGGQVNYYKIDLIDTNKNRFDIQRNYHYAVKIKSVSRAGYSNFDDALAGASHNNTSLDPIIEKYPIFSDGSSKLEVEKTQVILTEPGQSLHVWARFYPDANTTNVDNSGVTVVLSPDNEALLDTTLSFDPVTNNITATALSTLPTVPKESCIVVTKGNLSRTIRVMLLPPFSFAPVTLNNSNPCILEEGQNKDAILQFTIPPNLPSNLFPLPIHIYTQGLTPSVSGIEIEVKGGLIYYNYYATQNGEQSITFKTNRSTNEETIALKNEYFTDGIVDYHTDKITIFGTIQYNKRLSLYNDWSSVLGYELVTVAGVSGASILVSPAYRYTLTIPYTKENPTITFTYTKSGHTYTQTIDLNTLKGSTSLRLEWVSK